MMNADCVHYWLLEQPTPDGVHGRCKHCHAARVFTGSDRDAKSSQASRSRGAATKRRGRPVSLVARST